MDLYNFYTGQTFDAYKWLGAHFTPEATTFRTFAPQAQGVDLILADTSIPMKQVYNGQFYEATVEKLPCCTPYEYRIHSNNGHTDHCDPYGYFMELRPDHKSITWDLESYKFTDTKWMKKRSSMLQKPLNIYELHAGSFKKPGNQPDDWYNYEELGNVLIPYLQECSYNYVEFLPLCEHPCDESWGYQTTGYFSPTSRYGTPNQLMKLIDQLHQNDIGVILDFVPVHFAIDSYGLSKYDGTPLYEYPNNDVGISEWGSCNFMHSRGEVKSFLQSSANYWLKEFHFDGLRMDAVSRIIFWQGDERRGINGSALEFVKNMNNNLKQFNPGCMLIAEDSSSYQGITLKVEQGGLGFDYKWDLGWMNDTLSYFSIAPDQRSQHYHKLTFSMLYFKNEHYLLPLSHDEVVHEKGTIVNKMYGNENEKYAQSRALYMYMLVHPGKKLNFMGNELAQLREWSEKRQLDFELLQDSIHRQFHDFIKKLNRIYLTQPSLTEDDYEETGFQWVDCNQEQRLIYAFLRQNKKEKLLAVFNFSDSVQDNYIINSIDTKKPELLLCSDHTCFGGNTDEKTELFHLDNANNLIFSLPSYSGILIKL